MVVFNLFSKRQKQLRGEVIDVYQYDLLPKALRVQIVHILRDALGDDSEYQSAYSSNVREIYKLIVETLCREYGVFNLQQKTNGIRRSHIIELFDYVLEEPNTEKVMDAVELSCRALDKLTRLPEYLERYSSNYNDRVDNAIEELNQRFKEHGVGYQFISGEVIRIDSEFTHNEIVKPTLALLNSKGFGGAQNEFLSAHEHFRHGREKEAINDCLKALESTLKTIMDKKDWEYDKDRDSSAALIQKCIDNGLIPKFWLSHFSSLRTTLEAGVPTARNRLGGHGQGAEQISVPSYITGYILNMTASSIKFLMDAMES